MTFSEEHRDFKYNLLAWIMVVATVSAAVFALMHVLGMNVIGTVHAQVNATYSSILFGLVWLLKSKRLSFEVVLIGFVVTSYLTFVSALINVPDDSFRAIWFYLLVLVTFMLGGATMGIMVTAASLIGIFACVALFDLGLSEVSVMSVLLGLIIMSLMSFIFTNRVTCYTKVLDEKNATLKKMASEDDLTGIMNTRSFYDIGTSLFKLCQRQHMNLAVLYIDIDHFKKVNDVHGHLIGDHLLISLAQTIRTVLRDSDIFARIGGEEFCILLSDTDVRGGEILAEKIRSTVEASVMVVDDLELTATISIGVTQLNSEDSELKDLQSRADQALYKAKDQGRNRAVTL